VADLELLFSLIFEQQSDVVVTAVELAVQSLKDRITARIQHGLLTAPTSASADFKNAFRRKETIKNYLVSKKTITQIEEEQEESPKYSH